MGPNGLGRPHGSWACPASQNAWTARSAKLVVLRVGRLVHINHISARM